MGNTWLLREPTTDFTLREKPQQPSRTLFVVKLPLGGHPSSRAAPQASIPSFRLGQLLWGHRPRLTSPAPRAWPAKPRSSPGRRRVKEKKKTAGCSFCSAGIWLFQDSEVVSLQSETERKSPILGFPLFSDPLKRLCFAE